MGVSAIGGIGYPQPYTTPLSSGPDAVQRPSGPAEVTPQPQDAQNNAPSSSGGNTTPTRGQNLNITV